MRTLLLLLALGAIPVHASAQGLDSCQAPAVPITGTGPFVFDNSTAGGTLGAGMCVTAGRDVWFRWIAPTTDIYTVSTCGGTTLDTVLSVYTSDAGCPPPSANLACSDNACGTQSSATFHAVAGETYSIQIATRTAPGGTGTFSFTTGTPCAVTVGPDVVVGEIQEVANNGASGGLDAISLGVAACNVGDAEIEWIAIVDRHPVVATNLYRYSQESGFGRFEQIGMSWLFHGHGADTATLCCAPCAATDNWSLGVGCSTGHSAGHAGNQSGLGPRRQVDAWTGSIPYPPANPPGWCCTARRLQYLESDVILTPGTRYFAEAHYVTPDEFAPGNQDDNAGYREMTTTGPTFALVGATQSASPAIQAWATCEPGVSVVAARVPGEGLFHAACKVTDLGGGQWHYEYAVHNLNSHRSGGSFSLPIGAANVTNVGFHDVQYRNGDGEGDVDQSGLDWAVTNSGGVLTWASETQAANANANALRWSTTYNFRFDADVPPTSGAATIGLWRTGGVASIDAAVQVPRNALAFCSGDGSGTPCPCANAGATGNGCASSVNALGANLAASGVARVTADTLALAGSGMPNSSALYFQGTTQAGGGSGTVFGDGLRCAGGTTIRLATKTNAGGTSTYPVSGDLLISVRGAVAAGDVRTYQCWYRNAASFCSPSTFNLTNGLQLIWGA